MCTTVFIDKHLFHGEFKYTNAKIQPDNAKY